MSALEQFRDAIRQAGLNPPEVIEADGEIHRFSTNGKRADDAGWYVLHGDGIPAGCFGDWRTGINESWRADIGRALTHAEEAAYRLKVDEMRRKREAEEARRYAEAANHAAAIWKTSQPAPTDHPYLTRKNIQAHGARLYKGALIIPIREGRDIHSLQLIGANGEKRFLTGGRITGCYFSIGDPKSATALCIAEGFATSASIHEATGYPVAVAFNAGNLKAIALAMHAKFPDRELILCADDDIGTARNPGMSKAKEAAQAVGGKLAVPNFGANRPDGVTDFNDLFKLCGAEAVKQSVKNAMATTVRRTIAGFNLVSASEVLATVEPDTRWLWDGVLPEGGMSLLVGKPKAGKSTFAFALSLAVANGEDFLNRATTQGTVVYLALEEKRSEIKKKLEAAGGQIENLFFHFGAAPVDAISSVANLVKETKATLLIIDVLQKFIRARDLNDYALVTNALEPLLTVARESGCHVLLTHHAGKANRSSGDEVLGSTALLGGVDTLVSIKKHDTRRTFFTLQRYGDDIPETVIDLHQNGQLDALGSRNDVEIEEACRTILKVLGNEEMTREEVLDRVEQKRSVVLKALARLRDEKEIERRGSGKRGDPFTFKKVSVFPFPIALGNGGTETKNTCNPASPNDLFRSQEISKKDSVPGEGEDGWEDLPP
jgi:putative DNA primase/helicase